MKQIHKDLRQTNKYSHYMNSLGWDVINISSNLGYFKTIPFLGKVLKIQRYPKDIDLKDIKASAIYLEPLNKIPKDFTRTNNCFLPSKTIQINLLKSKEKILKNLSPKTRYNIKIALRNKVVINKSHEIETFINLWHQSAKKRNMWFSQKKEIQQLWKSFEQDAYLYFALHNKELIGGLFIIQTKNTAYYLYAASTEKGKKLFAPTLLAWQSILDAKKNKKSVYDFDGIYDERFSNTKNWLGFTKFKQGFGGEVITYPGTFVKYSNPLFKLLNF